MYRVFTLLANVSGRGHLARRSILYFVFVGILTLSFIPLGASLPLAGPPALAASPAMPTKLQTTSFALDGVTVAVQTPFLPHTTFAASKPGDTIQGAISVSYHPYREFSVTTAPFGTHPGSETLPVAQAGGAAAYRLALYTFRLKQAGNPQAGPTISLFGQQVPGEVSLSELHLDSPALKPTLIVEWVVEAGQRLWIVRISQEEPIGTLSLQTALPFLHSLSTLVLSSTTLDHPSTIAPATGHALRTALPTKQSPHMNGNLPWPSWWNGNCDSNNHGGSYPLGASYLGMPACGPLGGNFVVHFFSGAWGVLEWQCVELSMRYLYLAYSVAPYPANGSQVVWNYSGSALQKIGNGSVNAAPQAGDVLSYGPTNSNGHTSVVSSSNVDGNGNGSISVVEENASYNGAYTIIVSNWTVQPTYGMSITGWLHNPSSPPPTPTTRGIVLRGNGSSGYVLDGYGNITPFGGAPAVTGNATWNWVIARGIVLRSDGVSGYTLDGWGGVHPFGGAPAVSVTGYWQGWDIARAIVLRSDGASGYVLDGFGGIHPFGNAPGVTGYAYWQGWDIARGIVLRSDGTSGYTLDGWGGVHPFGGAPAVSVTGYWQGWDIARGIVLAGDGSNLFFPGNAGYVLDGFGGVHPFGNAPAVSASGYWSGQDRARGMAFIPGLNSGVYSDGYGQVATFHANNIGPIRSIVLHSDGASGYVLDGYGNITPFGGAPAVTGYATWNWDIARGMVLRSDGVSGYTLDGWGGVHPFGGAPAVSVTGYWQGWDIARGIVLRSDGASGYVLDGFGGIHPFGGAPPVTGYSYWQGWDIARGIALRSDGTSGYTLDGWGGVHPFGGAPAVTGYAYWQGWDIARGIILRSDGVSGYTLDGYGGVHPFGGAPTVSTSAYWPGADVAKDVALTPGSDSTGMYVNLDGGIGSFK